MNQFANQLHHCRCCPRQCGVDRLAGELGFCRIGGQALVSHLGLHHGEEPPLSGSRGSGAIFFTGCNLRCVFCQNHQISQALAPAEARAMSTADLARAMLGLQRQGAHNINFVSPSHVLWQMADAIVSARAQGLSIPVVYNSNGYDSVAALRQISGLIDIYLPDLKYQDAAMARRYSQAEGYSEGIGGVLHEMLSQVGHLEVGADGIARRGLLVRHLVLPAALDNSRQCLRVLADLDPAITISLMSQYTPQHQASRFPAIDRPLSEAEYEQLMDYALSLGLDHVFIQELSSQAVLLPDFEREEPFAG